MKKPADAPKFQWKTHQLICSVAVVCKAIGYQKVDVETAEVGFDEFGEDFIKRICRYGTTYDKAGGYAIQHPLVYPHVASISGRIDTIYRVAYPILWLSIG